jgi:hypothetical protein
MTTINNIQRAAAHTHAPQRMHTEKATRDKKGTSLPMAAAPHPMNLLFCHHFDGGKNFNCNRTSRNQ